MSNDESTGNRTDNHSPGQAGSTMESHSTASTSSKSQAAESKESKGPKRIYLVPYPKFIFMYPTFIVSIIAAVVLYLGGYRAVDPDASALPVVMTGLFLVVLTINTFILVFDFPRATSLTLVFVVISALLGLWMLVIAKPDLLPALGDVISRIRPVANASFFACIMIGMFFMYAAIFIKVRFDYWELRNNELLHHHGILSDLKRYPAPNLRVDKEINDVFEYLLLGAGRLILHPTSEKRAIVLDNILFVSDKERQLTKTLGSIKVQIGADSGEN